MSNGCKVNTRNKLIKSYDDLVYKGEISPFKLWISDDDFNKLVNNAEEKFKLKEKEKYHEMFKVDCIREIQDELVKRR